jgi:hypothetical protein
MQHQVLAKAHDRFQTIRGSTENSILHRAAHSSMALGSSNQVG